LRRVRKRTGRALGLALTLLLAAPLTAAEPQPQMSGDLQIHEPSVIEIGGQFVAVGTGQQGPTHGAIRAKTSPDGVRWTDAGLIGEGPPAWARATLGFKPSNVWAPSISRRGSTVSLYYCLSSFGHNTSAIGLMTNTFDRSSPAGVGRIRASS
jgi:arabinan endo-1,5-alpha-L-arabinosidase